MSKEKMNSRVTIRREAVRGMMRMRRFGEAGPFLTAISYAVVIVAALMAILPFFYIITTAIKESRLLFEYPPQWIPEKMYWGNFLHLLFDTYL